MFTYSVRVGCSFQACRGELVKYQICLIFPRPRLHPPGNRLVLVTSHLVSLLPGLSVTLPGLSFTSCRLVFCNSSTAHFQSICSMMGGENMTMSGMTKPVQMIIILKLRDSKGPHVCFK